jgi:hypothetical protein
MYYSRWIVCLLVALGLPARHRVQDPVLRLPSGHEIRVVSIGVMYFSKDKPAWMLKYETKTSFDDVPALRQEATEIWEHYKSTVERAGRDAAILSANEPVPDTFISKTRGYNFVVQKQPDGSWKMLE